MLKATPKYDSASLPRCPFCHDQITKNVRATVCRACFAPSHAACWNELGACPVCRSIDRLNEAPTHSGPMTETQAQSTLDVAPARNMNMEEQPATHEISSWQPHQSRQNRATHRLEITPKLNRFETISSSFAVPELFFEQSIEEIFDGILSLDEVRRGQTNDFNQGRVTRAIEELRIFSRSELIFSFVSHVFVSVFASVLIGYFLRYSPGTVMKHSLLALNGVILSAFLFRFYNSRISLNQLKDHAIKRASHDQISAIPVYVLQKAEFTASNNWFLPDLDSPGSVFARKCRRYVVEVSPAHGDFAYLESSIEPNHRVLTLSANELQPEVGDCVVCYVAGDTLLGYDIYYPARELNGQLEDSNEQTERERTLNRVEQVFPIPMHRTRGR